MSGAKDESLTEARIRDAMEAIRERIVRPVRIGGRQVYVYDPTWPRADVETQWKGDKNAAD